ncbi:MAG: class I SAM-dependent methyltransferase [Candidatus Nanoarchaeia archaeon]|jgi:SAM-dependent methyltransferase
MKLYHKLAKYYDYLFSGDYEQETRVVCKILKRLEIKGLLLLDVGCATGRHMTAFKKLGYEVEGLDNSKEIISIAKEKMPGTIFYKQKMQRMKTNKKYDVITLLSRALLFVRNEKELTYLINHLARQLKHRGALVMDLDLHKDYFDADKSDAHYFNNDGVEGSMVEEYDISNDKVLWAVNLSISDHGRIIRHIDDQRFLMVKIKSLLKIMRVAGLKPSVYDMKGKATKNYKQGLIIAGANKNSD